MDAPGKPGPDKQRGSRKLGGKCASLCRNQEPAMFICRVIISAALLLGASAAHAQTLKSGTLSLVVPFASGGPSDVAGRILAQGLQDALGQTVVVENPVGGGGTVGSLRVSRGTPDGR